MLVKIVYENGSIEAFEAMRYEQNAGDWDFHIWLKNGDDIGRPISISIVDISIGDDWVYHRGDWINPNTDNWMIKDHMEGSIFYAKWYGEDGAIEYLRKVDKAEYETAFREFGRHADKIAFTLWRRRER